MSIIQSGLDGMLRLKSHKIERALKDGDLGEAVSLAVTEQSKFQASRLAVVAAAIKADPALHGKAHVALEMLANEEFSAASGESILTMLSHVPAHTASAEDLAEVREAAEVAARAEMKAAIQSNANSNIDPSGGGSSRGPANHAGVWAQARARVFGKEGQ